MITLTVKWRIDGKGTSTEAPVKRLLKKWEKMVAKTSMKRVEVVNTFKKKKSSLGFASFLPRSHSHFRSLLTAFWDSSGVSARRWIKTALPMSPPFLPPLIDIPLPNTAQKVLVFQKGLRETHLTLCEGFFFYEWGKEWHSIHVFLKSKMQSIWKKIKNGKGKHFSKCTPWTNKFEKHCNRVQ